MSEPKFAPYYYIILNQHGLPLSWSLDIADYGAWMAIDGYRGRTIEELRAMGYTLRKVKLQFYEEGK